MEYIHNNLNKNHVVVTILCKKNLVEELIKDLSVMTYLVNKKIEFEFIHLDKELNSKYGVSLILDNGNLRLNVETAWNVYRYRDFYADYLYISKDCDTELSKNQFMITDYFTTFDIKGVANE